MTYGQTKGKSAHPKSGGSMDGGTRVGRGGDRHPDGIDPKITGDRPIKTPPKPAFSVNRP
ncbi:hypothetical protein [Laspinema olomoucense]|uniref:Uncharacterized protein n=1 Tax=Laspinema olomoucense D3b TaxID=2953688 RepID=A0ABT2N3E6_9CYAN|nr:MULTISPECIES: hypothetical protein [unclassified Laspinema]MCT7971729.1 hypothetical protein [Laspinema sp. D3d]MCT7977212.1 hypothetical protein [Laspinema sp. D3b]MCT7989861.1 hypothetical protein [Laspinema sp. D3a]